jgi:hypothetical protein
MEISRALCPDKIYKSGQGCPNCVIPAVSVGFEFHPISTSHLFLWALHEPLVTVSLAKVGDQIAKHMVTTEL